MSPSQRASQNFNVSTTIKMGTSSSESPPSTPSTISTFSSSSMSSGSPSPPRSPPPDTGRAHPSSSSSTSHYPSESPSSPIITPYTLYSSSWTTPPVPASWTSNPRSRSNVSPLNHPTSPQYPTSHLPPDYNFAGMSSTSSCSRSKPAFVPIASPSASTSDRDSNRGGRVRPQRNIRSMPYARLSGGSAVTLLTGNKTSRSRQSSTTDSYGNPTMGIIALSTQPEEQEDRFGDRIERLTGRRPRRWTTPPPPHIRKAAMEEMRSWDASNDLGAQYSTLPLYTFIDESEGLEDSNGWVDHNVHDLL